MQWVDEIEKMIDVAESHDLHFWTSKDCRKLIHAVRVAEEALEDARQRLMWGNSSEACINVNTILVQGIAKLHSGEFGDGDTNA